MTSDQEYCRCAVASIFRNSNDLGRVRRGCACGIAWNATALKFLRSPTFRIGVSCPHEITRLHFAAPDKNMVTWTWTHALRCSMTTPSMLFIAEGATTDNRNFSTVSTFVAVAPQSSPKMTSLQCLQSSQAISLAAVTQPVHKMTGQHESTTAQQHDSTTARQHDSTTTTTTTQRQRRR